ncbi:hypothetical protein G9A89_008674 [Geosiphon pyriformis]|nr:hypothetical protein G9A89_008674 [Geosiphon pyriformis]
MPKEILKVVLIGDGGVGKVSVLLIYAFTSRSDASRKLLKLMYVLTLIDLFKESATIGADFTTKEVRRENGKKVILQIWDTAGQERFQSLGVAFYRGADACVLVYDVNKLITFENLERWRAEFLKHSGVSDPSEFPFIVIGNKIDLNDRQVPKRRIREFAQKYSGSTTQISCFEASAKEGINVEAAFTHIARVVKMPQFELDIIDGDNESFYLKNRLTKEFLLNLLMVHTGKFLWYPLILALRTKMFFLRNIARGLTTTTAAVQRGRYVAQIIGSGAFTIFLGQRGFMSETETGIPKNHLVWKLGRLNHVAFAVPDIEKSAYFWRCIMGAGSVSEQVTLPEHGVHTVFVNLGNTKIELLGEINDRSPIHSFLLKNKSGGVHHVCIEVDNVTNAVKNLVAQNIRVLDPVPKIGAHGNPVVFLHPKDCGGVLVELEQIS